jgi:hypothetical protein
MNLDDERNGVLDLDVLKADGINLFIQPDGFPGISKEQKTWTQAYPQIALDHGVYMYAAGENGPDDVNFAVTLPGMAAVRGWFGGDEQDMNKAGDCASDCWSTNWSTKMNAVKAAQPSRPLYNNFGMGFADYPWIGYQCDVGGAGCADSLKLTELKRYCGPVDIVSADDYAFASGEDRQDLSLRVPTTYGRVIDNVRMLCGGGTKPVYGFVETGHPFSDTEHPNYTITPDQLEQAVWSMLAHGANGILYFGHDYYDHDATHNEDGMFDHPATLARMKQVNATIASLATILNAQRLTSGMTTGPSVDATYRAGGYVVAAESMGAAGYRSITIAGAAGHTIQVVGENRTLVADASGTFTDIFDAWGHHIYHVL